MDNNEEKLKKDIVRTMSLLYRRRLVTSLSGNVSARLALANEFWITPSGLFKGKLRSQHLVKCNLETKILNGSLKPSIETSIHALIYKRRSDVNAVVHAHNPVTIGLSLAGLEIKPVTVESALILSQVPMVKFAYPGSETLANLVAKNIMNCQVVILENHGVISVGHDLLTALSAIEILEETAITILTAKLFSKLSEAKISEIPKEDVQAMRKLLNRVHANQLDSCS